MKNDQLSDALRRGDPAGAQTEARTAQERQAALLARCAAEPTAFQDTPLVAQNVRLRKMRWAFPALAGAGALTAAALYGAAAWFGINHRPSQTNRARIVQASPRPNAAPAPHRAVAEQVDKNPRTNPSASVALENAEQKTARTVHRNKSIAAAPSKNRAQKGAVSETAIRRPDESLPAPTKTIVRTNHKKDAAAPHLVAATSKSQPAPLKIAEPVVERVIIVQDDTPAAEPTPPVTTVAIAINGRAESVIVSRAAEPAPN